MEENTYVKTLIEEFDNACESQETLDEQTKDRLAGIIPSADEFRNALPALKAAKDLYEANAESADKNKKTWDASKKLWKNRSETLMDIIGRCVKKFRYSGKVTMDDTTLNISSRSYVDIDTDWLLSQYQGTIDTARAMLPEFIKLEVSVDKNKLSAFLKTDDTLLKDHPDKIHYNVSGSISFKK